MKWIRIANFIEKLENLEELASKYKELAENTAEPASRDVLAKCIIDLAKDAKDVMRESECIAGLIGSDIENH